VNRWTDLSPELSRYVVVMQVSVTEVNGVLGTPGVPLMDLLWTAVTAGQDIEATRFRGHAVSQLMRRFRKEVGGCMCVGCEGWHCLYVCCGFCPCLICMQYYEDREALLHYYVQPLVVEEVPPNLTSAQFVADCEKDSAAATQGGVYAAPAPLATEATAFLASTDRLLLLLGEAGSGKSMFTWLNAVEHMGAFEALASRVGGGGSGGSPGTAPESGVDPAPPRQVWIPVVIDLKHYRTSELLGLLPRALQVSACVSYGWQSMYLCVGLSLSLASPSS
jgi:hypothetical protein